jgi:hypothetical protein
MRVAAAVIVALVLLAYAWGAPKLRHEWVRDVITFDAEPTDPVELPASVGAGLPPAQRVRVILIDGLSASTAHTMTTWSSLCNQGISTTVDVGFPTVSLPIQVSLWTGLTQQQTGVVFRSDVPIVPPLARSIPRGVPGSLAVAENHGYIVQSIGFAQALPTTTGAKDNDPKTWATQWEGAALSVVSSQAPLAFVHVLSVDTMGHRKGRDSDEYRNAARAADAMLAKLYTVAPDARWFLLSDHGHLPRGGHGGEERDVRQIQHCILGPGIAPQHGGLVHLVDISRAIADSVGVQPDPRSQGRPLFAALKAPLEDDVALPRMPLSRGALAAAILALAVAASVWGVRRWWLAPVWFFLGCVLLLLVRGVPTMSTPMMYARDGRLMYLAWAAALPFAIFATYFGLRSHSLARVLVGQLAIPFGALAACITACVGWRTLFGAEVAPVVPYFTAIVSPLLLLTAHGSAVVALSVLARLVHSAFDRQPPQETRRSVPSTD